MVSTVGRFWTQKGQKTAIPYILRGTVKILGGSTLMNHRAPTPIMIGFGLESGSL